MTMPFRARQRWHGLTENFEKGQTGKPRKIPEELHCLLLSTTEGAVKRALAPELDKYEEGVGWWYLPDNSKPARQRPLFVAHVDTLCKPFPPSIVAMDKDRSVFTPDGILGADDRAGVAACLELRRKYGVSILLCDGEEAGGWGARSASKQAADLILQHPYMIELDRQGVMEVVYYRQEDKAFKKLFSDVGYWEFGGSFSDIAIISRELDLPGANVSVGFRHQHSKYEHLILGAYEDTLDRLSMLVENNPAYTYTPKALTEVEEMEVVDEVKDAHDLLSNYPDSWYWRNDEYYPGIRGI